MAEVKRDEDGRYITKGLSSKAFHKVFDAIQKTQRAKRRKAKRTLTPSILGVKNKALDTFLGLGKKKDGTYFTPDDIAQFHTQRKEHKANFDSGTAGITYAQMVSQSTDIDVKRASNRVSDGTGITSATFLSIKHNLGLFSVKASQESKFAHHRVKVRFEQWDDAVEQAGEEDAKIDVIAGNMAKGRLSIDCDCGRHQYWYRYMATAGNYCVAPPKEYAFPKIRNPELTGVACKHVLHVVTRLQSKSWHKGLTNALTKAAQSVSFGDDKRKTTTHFSGSVAKEMARNRQATTDKRKAQSEYERYVKAQAALGNVLKRKDPSTSKVRQLLKKARATSTRNALARKTAEEKAAKARQETADLKKALKAQAENLIKYFVSTGMTKEAATAQAKTVLQTQLKAPKR